MSSTIGQFTVQLDWAVINNKYQAPLVLPPPEESPVNVVVASGGVYVQVRMRSRELWSSPLGQTEVGTSQARYVSCQAPRARPYELLSLVVPNREELLAAMRKYRPCRPASCLGQNHKVLIRRCGLFDHESRGLQPVHRGSSQRFVHPDLDGGILIYPCSNLVRVIEVNVLSGHGIDSVLDSLFQASHSLSHSTSSTCVSTKNDIGSASLQCFAHRRL